MKKSEYTLKSDYDGLELAVEVMEPDKDDAKGIVQISHGMAEHKERYEPFMEFLATHGYVAVIHDHRGHGKSIRSNEDLGFFYTKDINAIVDDLHQVTVFAKEMYPGLPVYLFSHSMGTLVARNYLKKYDDAIEKLVLCGPPTENGAVGLGVVLGKLSTLFRGEHYRSAFLDSLATGGFNKKYAHIAKNAWICSDIDVVNTYNGDELCGYCFTNNGFQNLFMLQKEAFQKSGWEMKHPGLPILVIAGAQDPVITNQEKFHKLKTFLQERGYQNVQAKLYENKRHELLNETEKEVVFEEVLQFFAS